MVEEGGLNLGRSKTSETKQLFLSALSFQRIAKEGTGMQSKSKELFK